MKQGTFSTYITLSSQRKRGAQMLPQISCIFSLGAVDKETFIYLFKVHLQ